MPAAGNMFLKVRFHVTCQGGDIHLACVYMNVCVVCVSEGCKEVSASLNPRLQRNTCYPPCLIYHLPDSEDRPAQSLWVGADSQLQSASYI